MAFVVPEWEPLTGCPAGSFWIKASTYTFADFLPFEKKSVPTLWDVSKLFNA